MPSIHQTKFTYERESRRRRSVSARSSALTAQSLGEQLLQQHGLSAASWQVGDLGGLRRDWARNMEGPDPYYMLAFCSLATKVIWLPFDEMRHWSEVKQRDLILHEIAHTLVGPREHGPDHDPVWAETALRIGMRKRALAEDLEAAVDLCFPSKTQALACEQHDAA
jgi:hypothetical protein